MTVLAILTALKLPASGAQFNGSSVIINAAADFPKYDNCSQQTRAHYSVVKCKFNSSLISTYTM